MMKALSSLGIGLLIAAAPAQAAWHEASTEHFVIYSDDKPDNIKRFATRLESFDKLMRVRRGLPDETIGKANRVTVYVLPSVASISKLAGDRDAAGFYVPRAGGSAAFVPRYSGSGESELTAQTVLLHEYAHHFMFSHFPDMAYPLWLSEGYAEFHSTARFERNGDITIGAAPMYRAWGLLSGNPLPVQRMLTLTNEKLSPDQREAIYGRGWLLLHYLIFDSARGPQLEAYFAALNAGKPVAEAAQAFGDLGQLGKDLDRYLNRPKISALTIRASRLGIGEVKVRALTPGEAATMPVRIRSKRGVDAESAKAVVVEARKRAAPFPNDAAAQTVLAEAEYDAGNLDAAEAAADRALAVDARAIDALVYKGMAKMARAANAGSADEATWKEVRRWFLAANRIDPDDPEPLMLFYSSFDAAGVKPTANAVLGLTQAFALAPQDTSLRMTVARQFLSDGKAADARATLRPVATYPHGGGASEFARAQIALLDKGDVAGALAAWSARGDDSDDDADPPASPSP